ncbi:MAG: serine/threonine protein kinase [Betaproteobacteria bacterium]|nr:MAG: serine/threonine protein kinase [Betaproteobacteria bacterium]
MKSAFGISKELWPEASSLFDELSELDATSREAKLRSMRLREPALANAVEKLFARTAAQPKARAQHNESTARASAVDAHSFDAVLRDALLEPGEQYLAGDRFGAWTLIEPLGRGGMGEVWRARRSDGLFEGEAAIKLLRTDLPAERLAARFARERSVLARLNHPNIARLLDAGVGGKDGKQAFLVLELVEGTPFERFLHGKQVDTRVRVALVRDVAKAVAYAHAQLVLHRDIKPSNVLIDQDGRVKLLDFGIAAEIGDEADAQSASALTQLTGRGLTLEYAAPEQVIGEATSTASDTYSLGALLYFALSGAHPFAELSNRAALNRAVLEQPPTRVRQRVLDRWQKNAQLGNQDDPFHTVEVDDDLDAIVAKSLRKRPQDRYPSAQSFASDLDSWLTHEPISIRADDRAYRWRLWFSRNRALAAASALAGIALLGGVIASVMQRNEAIAQAESAERARAEALRNEKRATTALAELAQQVNKTEAASRRALDAQNAAELAKQRAVDALDAETRAASTTRAALLRAERERLIAEEQTRRAESERRLSESTSRFVTGLFEAADPERALGEKLSALAVLEAGSKTLEAEATTDPRVAAAIGTTLGRVFNHLSRPDRAIPLLERALALAEAQHGEQSKQAIDARYEYARALERKERFAEAVPLYRSLVALPADAPLDIKRRVFSRMELAFSLGKLGKFDEADAAQRELEQAVESLPKDDWLRVEAIASRAVLASMRGQWQETFRLYSGLGDRINQPPPGHARDALLMRFGFATSSLATSNPEAAAALFPPLHAESERLLGPDAHETLQFLWHVGFTQRNAWDLAGCIASYDQAYAGRARTSGPTHALTLDAGLWAATCRAYIGEKRAAADVLQRFMPTLLSVADVGRTDMRNLLTASMLALQLENFNDADRLVGALQTAINKLNLGQTVEAVRADLLGVLLLHGKHRDIVRTQGALDAMINKRQNTPTGNLVRSNFEVFSTQAQLAALSGNCELLRTHATAARAALLRRSGSKHSHLAKLEQSSAHCRPRDGGLTPAALGVL